MDFLCVTSRMLVYRDEKAWDVYLSIGIVVAYVVVVCFSSSRVAGSLFRVLVKAALASQPLPRHWQSIGSQMPKEMWPCSTGMYNAA
jgi:hypothetical protein